MSDTWRRVWVLWGERKFGEAHRSAKTGRWITRNHRPELTCRAATDFDSPPLGLADGRFHSVTLAPGKRQAFLVDNHDFLFDTLPYATRYPGGRCRLHLHLENSKEVVSTEFTP